MIKEAYEAGIKEAEAVLEKEGFIGAALKGAGNIARSMGAPRVGARLRSVSAPANKAMVGVGQQARNAAAGATKFVRRNPKSAVGGAAAGSYGVGSMGGGRD